LAREAASSKRWTGSRTARTCPDCGPERLRERFTLVHYGPSRRLFCGPSSRMDRINVQNGCFNKQLFIRSAHHARPPPAAGIESRRLPVLQHGKERDQLTGDGSCGLHLMIATTY
jgi:hypothetical protein